MNTAERLAHNVGKTRFQPISRFQTPPWSEEIAGPIAPFDLRPRRDLSSRRLAKDWGRNFLRSAVLLVGDSLVTLIALQLTLATATQIPVEGMNYLPRFMVMVLFALAAAGTYRAGRAHAAYGRLLLGVLAASLARATVDSVYGVPSFGVPDYAILGVILAVGLCIWRFFVSVGIRSAYNRGYCQKRTLVVANGERALEVLARFRSADEPRFRIMGHISPRASGDSDALGSIGDLGPIIEKHDISYVVVAGDLPKDAFEDVVRTCFLHGAAVSLIPATLARLPCRVTTGDILGWPLLELEAPRIHVLQVFVKRSMDIVLSLLLMLVLAPVFALIALAIRLESKGPVFFSQARPGLGGKRFLMFKFRTMRPAAERILRSNAELFRRFLRNDCKLPLDEDPRISRVGAYLRRASLDELPQLWNVLRGDMSLIGPRPMVGPELSYFGHWTSTVLGVRPGMTGYWQVAGRSKIMFPERAHLDVYYVTKWSLGLDLKILLLTLPAVLRRSGAF